MHGWTPGDYIYCHHHLSGSDPGGRAGTSNLGVTHEKAFHALHGARALYKERRNRPVHTTAILVNRQTVAVIVRMRVYRPGIGSVE